MAITDFFDTFNKVHLSGVIDDPIVTDADGTPNRVLELDRENTVDITWRITSDDPDMNPATYSNGKWVIQLSFESFGTALEFELDPEEVLLADANPKTKALCEWKKQIKIPANKAEESVYKMVTLITYRDDDGNRGSMAGFSEGPVLTFYKDTGTP